MWHMFAQFSNRNNSILPSRRSTMLKSFDELIPVANDANFSWITNLTIKDKEVSARDLISVSDLKNLRRFHMASARKTPTDLGFNDRIFRAWAEMARDHGAFKYLECLFLYFQEGVSKWSLEYLDAFPVLDEFCAHRCKVSRRDARSIPGWPPCRP